MAGLYCSACASDRVHDTGTSITQAIPVVQCRDCGARGPATRSLEAATGAIAERERYRRERNAARRVVRR